MLNYRARPYNKGRNQNRSTWKNNQQQHRMITKHIPTNTNYCSLYRSSSATLTYDILAEALFINQIKNQFHSRVP